MTSTFYNVSQLMFYFAFYTLQLWIKDIINCWILFQHEHYAFHANYDLELIKLFKMLICIIYNSASPEFNYMPEVQLKMLVALSMTFLLM